MRSADRRLRVREGEERRRRRHRHARGRRRDLRDAGTAVRVRRGPHRGPRRRCPTSQIRRTIDIDAGHAVLGEGARRLRSRRSSISACSPSVELTPELPASSESAPVPPVGAGPREARALAPPHARRRRRSRVRLAEDGRARPHRLGGSQLPRRAPDVLRAVPSGRRPLPDARQQPGRADEVSPRGAPAPRVQRSRASSRRAPRASSVPSSTSTPCSSTPNPLPDERVIGYGEVTERDRRSSARSGSSSARSRTTLQVAYPFAYVGEKDPTLSLVVISYPELYTTLDFRDDKVHPTQGHLPRQLVPGRRGRLRRRRERLQGPARGARLRPALPEEARARDARRRSACSRRRTTADVVQERSEQRRRPRRARSERRTTSSRSFAASSPAARTRIAATRSAASVLTTSCRSSRRRSKPGKVNAECVTGARRSRSTIAAGRRRAASRCGRPPSSSATRSAGPLSVATFCDASDVSPQENDFRFGHLHLSCGGGGRYDTPAGPIRLDIGYRIPGLQVLGGLTPDERRAGHAAWHPNRSAHRHRRSVLMPPVAGAEPRACSGSSERWSGRTVTFVTATAAAARRPPRRRRRRAGSSRRR